MRLVRNIFLKYLPILLLLLPLITVSQEEEDKEKYYKDLVQFTGVVVTGDSLKPVPFTHILAINRGFGTVSDYYGYFSFAAYKGDTIEFSSIGFKKSHFIIPDTIRSPRYTVFQVMTADTIYLSETVIYPWPSKEQFKEAFLSLDPPDDDLEIARKNLEASQIYVRALEMPMDGAMNYRHYINQTTSKLYSYGSLQPYYGIFDVVAWGKFFKAWQEGQFKRKYKP
jgi:hypothetical protein